MNNSRKAELIAFLNNHRKDEDSATAISHVSMITPKGSFIINGTGINQFKQLYMNNLLVNGDVMGLAEKPIMGDTGQFRLDIDIKVRTDCVKNLYTYDDIVKFIKIINQLLHERVSGCTNINLISVLLEKKPYVKKSYGDDDLEISNGFHLQFPYIHINQDFQRDVIIPELKRILKENPIGNITSDSIDESCTRVAWLMYGSKKSESSESYSVSKIYSMEMKELTLFEAFGKYRIYKQFSATFIDFSIALEDDRFHERLYNDCKSIDDIITTNITYYLPIILGITSNNRGNALKSGGGDGYVLDVVTNKQIESRTVKKIPMSHEIKYDNNTMEVPEILEDAEKLMELFSPHRWDDRYEWLKIGWALYSSTKGSSDGLDLWRSFSERSEKYQPKKTLEYDDCEYEWRSMKQMKGGYTMGTLRYIANEDNPVEYRKFLSKKTDIVFDNDLTYTGYDYDLANVFYSEFQDEFVCVSKNGKDVFWYKYVGHKWEKLDDDGDIKKCLNTVIHKRYNTKYFKVKEALSKLERERNDIPPNEYNRKKESLVTKHDIIKKILAYLKTDNKLKNIISAAKTMFADPKLNFKMDMNKYLIGFADGVYDLEQCLFRPGRPSDFISRCIPHNFPTEFNEMSKGVVKVNKFFEKVFPDISVREYFLNINSELFIGGNRRKMIQMWTGIGDNAKSVTESLFEESLGTGYSLKLPTSLITGKRTASSNATPEMARLNGVRWAVLQEPNKKDFVNQGVLKELTGNDTFFARELFCNGRDIIPMHKLVIVCNDLLKLPYNDPAIWNRMKIIPFESVFVDEKHLPPDEAEQFRQKKFLKDPDFADGIKDMCRPLLWILIDRYEKSKALNFKVEESPKVAGATKKYQMDNDVHYKFVNACVCDSENKNDSMSLNEFYKKFKDWYMEGFGNKHIPSREDTEEYLLKEWGKRNPKTLKWECKIFREDLVDMDEDFEK